MPTQSIRRGSRARFCWIGVGIAAGAGFAIAVPLPMTLEDFHLSGTQVGEVSTGTILTSDNCALCHGNFDPANEPFATWQGSLMAQAGRDPLFYAQMTSANQDVANVGYFCLRCHVPLSFVTGHADAPSGNTLDSVDRDGVTCHVCHSMIDPVYVPGTSPPADEAILDGLTDLPQHYGNAMFVLDPSGARRGPYADAAAPHAAIHSPFHSSGEFCGTCHDVGNVAVTRQPDGTYAYNNLNERTPTEDLHEQFPLERTYTEWKLSDFANGGVDMGGRFGGTGVTVVGTCQDCHMPRTVAKGCIYGPVRTDLARHEFAGASAWVLEIIGEHYAGDPEVDPVALENGRRAAVAMVERAASLELFQDEALLRARVVNETGHKLPTGHIEGRRVWINVEFLDASDQPLLEYGHYDTQEAELDEGSTTVYEMHVGLSAGAAQTTGLPPGTTTHMALADTIVKDTRIPPRGFDNAAYEAAGAPAVGVAYADGQYWHDALFWIPEGADEAVVTVNYQTVTRHYIEALRDGNVTDDWGDTLYDLWLATNKGAPIPIVSDQLTLVPLVRGDFNDDTAIDAADRDELESCFTGGGGGPVGPHCARGDFDGDGDVDCYDWIRFTEGWTGPGSPALSACSAPPAAVPDGMRVPGGQMLVAKAGSGALALSWDVSCQEADGDYEIYEGLLGDFSSHLATACTTSGLTGATLVPLAASTYYLVVPRSASAEGSYGTNSDGGERVPAALSCRPQVLGECS